MRPDCPAAAACLQSVCGWFYKRRYPPARTGCAAVRCRSAAGWPPLSHPGAPPRRRAAAPGRRASRSGDWPPAPPAPGSGCFPDRRPPARS
ncbi:Hypothetical protein SMB2099_2455 [Serratia marcescens SMB2099]|nr:Hypothetical protein SMB2099_2455 [Serratia marcescens SMB2099]